MDIISVWSRRLAERVTPHEIDFAAEVGSAYAAGGERRRNLFDPGRPGEPGGFATGGGISELPVILDALRAAAEYLHALLADGMIGNTLAVYALIQSVRNKGAQPLRSATLPGAAPVSGPLDPDEGRLLDRAIAVLVEQLQGHGYSREKAEERAYEVLETVFDSGNALENIRELLSALVATAPALPPPGRRPTRSWMLPPWLWFYMIAYLVVGMPGLINEWIRQANEYWALMTNSPAGVARNAGILLSVASVAQLFPALVLLAGIAGLLLPRWSGRRAERRHELAHNDNPVVEEIAAFVAQHDPSITITYSVHGRLLARIYPMGRTKARIAVFRPLTILWHADRQAAEAVVLHEIAHRRQGDHLIVGLASPFTWMVRVWGPLAALVAFIPIALYAASGAPAGPELTAQLLVNLTIMLRTLILPVTALWLAEFSADRLAIQERGVDALDRALAWQERKVPVGTVLRTISLLTHPPTGLRRAVAGGRFGGLAVLALAWPAALLSRLVLLSAVALPAFMLNGESLSTAASHVPQSIANALAYDWLLLVGTTALLIAWPLIIRPRHADGTKARLIPYLIASLIPLALYTVGLIGGETS